MHTYQTCESNPNPTVIVARSKKLYVKFHSSSLQNAGGFKMRFATYKGKRIINMSLEEATKYSSSFHTVAIVYR